MVPKSASFAYDTCVRMLDESSRQIASLDSNAGVLVAADGVIVGLVLGRVPSGFGIGVAVQLFAGSLVLTSFALAVIAFVIRAYQAAPAIRTLAGMVDLAENDLKWHFVPNLVDAVDDNRERIRRKGYFLASAQFTLLAALVPVGAYFLVSSISGR